MRSIRFTPRRAPLTLAVAALIAGGFCLAPGARAAKTTPAAHRPATPSAAALLARLGLPRTAGSYLDQRPGATVITVTDQAAALAVRTAGFTPRLVRHSAAELNGISSSLDRTAGVVGAAWAIGTAWAVDPATNAVVVVADRTVSRASLATLTSLTRRFGDAVHIQRVAGRFSLRISGGSAIYGGGFRCSLGFNVKNGTTHYFLTAGHCGQVVSTWYADAQHGRLLGPTTGFSFPEHDYAIVQVTGTIKTPGTVGSQNIKSAGTPQVGQTVWRRGSTTGVHTGVVTALNATVHYPEGTVTGLIETTVCAESGDSGGPLYAGTTAYGLTSGGDGDCTSGGTTFFQPVVPALNAYGVHVY